MAERRAGVLSSKTQFCLCHKLLSAPPQNAGVQEYYLCFTPTATMKCDVRLKGPEKNVPLVRSCAVTGMHIMTTHRNGSCIWSLWLLWVP